MKYNNLNLLHNIGDIKHINYNTRGQIIKHSDQQLGFDGVYLNVYENQDILESKSGIFFVMGDFVGKDNRFDLKHVPRLEKYCTWDQIHEMCDKYDFEIGWHTWSHPDLTKLSRGEIIKEITPPWKMEYFAYPHGKFNQLVIDCVKEVGYKYAWSVVQGTNDFNVQDYEYKLNRKLIR
jgi:hypothetical protein